MTQNLEDIDETIKILLEHKIKNEPPIKNENFRNKRYREPNRC